jgi:hypothetical protein
MIAASSDSASNGWIVRISRSTEKMRRRRRLFLKLKKAVSISTSHLK